MTECARCGACCSVIPLSILNMSPEYRKYLLTRGLKVEQGFILIPHECQHLVYESQVIGFNEDIGNTIDETICACDIHDSPDRPFVCRKFVGQNRIGRAKIYVPPECAYRKK